MIFIEMGHTFDTGRIDEENVVILRGRDSSTTIRTRVQVSTGTIHFCISWRYRDKRERNRARDCSRGTVR